MITSQAILLWKLMHYWVTKTNTFHWTILQQILHQMKTWIHLYRLQNVDLYILNVSLNVAGKCGQTSILWRQKWEYTRHELNSKQYRIVLYSKQLSRHKLILFPLGNQFVVLLISRRYSNVSFKTLPWIIFSN